MLRLLLFVGTNVAVLLLLSVVMKVFGIEQALYRQGLGNLTGLLIMAGVMGMAGSFISLAISKWMAKRSTGAKVIENPRGEMEVWLVDTVARQAEQAGIGMPEVAIFDSAAPNAFATGMRKNDALVAVSTGLLRHMNRDEVEAVLGHEVAHVANGDMVTMALLQGVLNTFVIFLSRIIGMVVDRVIFKNERGYGPGFWITSMVAQVALGMLATIIAMWFSRYREFRADEGGARLAGREKMISALRALGRGHSDPDLPEAVEAFGIAGRFSGGSLQKLFMSHPPLPERIASLERGNP